MDVLSRRRQRMTALSCIGWLLAMEVSLRYLSLCIILYFFNEYLTGLFGSLKAKDESVEYTPAMILRQRSKQLSSRSQTVGQLCRSGPMAWIMVSHHWLSLSLKILHMDLEGMGSPRVFGEFLLQHLDVKFPKSISKLLGLGFQYTSLRIGVRVWVKVFQIELHH